MTVSFAENGIPHIPIIDKSLGHGIEIIDNFLPIQVFQQLAGGIMNSSHFQSCDYTAYPEESDGSISRFGEPLIPSPNKYELNFQAVLFFHTVGMNEVSDFYLTHRQLIDIMTQLMGVKKLWVMRANCTIGQDKNYVGRFHKDYAEKSLLERSKTAVFYLNTNNGGTQLFNDNGHIVRSKANRLLSFPSATDHAGVWCTDAKLRHVLNINYEI